MKKDKLHQFVSLRDQLLREKTELVSRLSEINAALGDVRVTPVAAPAPAVGASAPVRRGRRPKNTARSAPAAAAGGRRKRARNAMSLREAVMAVTKSRPLSRQDLLKAVQASGYVFTAKDPLNSLSTLLYSDKGIRNTNGKFGPA